MKRNYILTVLALVIAIKSAACDICGCGVGNSYIGILPDFNKHIFGFRFRYNSLLTHVGVGGTTSYLTSSEQYRTMELWAGWNVGKQFRLLVSIPYSFDERKNQGLTNSKNGLGDISVAAYYQLINNRKTIGDKLLVQSLWAGVGIKVPSGKYNPIDKSSTAETANLFQLGTGSTDFTINILYDIRLQDAGISASASYKINTSNKYSYSYGNKLSLTGQAYYKFRIKDRLTIAPNAGILYEKGEKDIDNKFSVDISGGNLVMGTAGLELSFKKMAIGGNFQTPLSQNLASGIIKANNRAMLHISFLL